MMSEPLAEKLVSGNWIFPKRTIDVQPVIQGDANPEGVTVGQLNDFGGEVGARSKNKEHCSFFPCQPANKCKSSEFAQEKERRAG